MAHQFLQAKEQMVHIHFLLHLLLQILFITMQLAVAVVELVVERHQRVLKEVLEVLVVVVYHLPLV